jgi:hypothetical protein
MADKTQRLVSPTGVTVTVSDEQAAVLVATGYVAESSKAPAKKAASSTTKKS